MKERMVPVQQLADVEDDLLRLAAAKDAEIARLRNTIGWEASVAYRAEIAALTEQRDRAMAVVEAMKRYAGGADWRELDDDIADTLAALDAEAAAETEGN